MSYRILSHTAASISELKANPMQVVQSAEGQALAILNHNKPAFYCVPAAMYEAIMDQLEDMELAEIVRAREGQPEISVTLDELVNL